MNAKNLFLSVFIALIAINVTAQSWNCGHPNETDVKATFNNGTMTITGKGKMVDYDYDEPPWTYVKEQIQNVTIGSGVTSIGNYSFSDCESLTELYIGNTVEAIGAGAFAWCDISFVDIPEGVKKIGEKSFARGNVAYLVIPSSVKEIGMFAFYGSELKEISVSWDNPADVMITTTCEDCPEEEIDPFYELDRSAVILHVPVGATEAYKASKIWKDFNIVDDGINIGGINNHLLENLTVSTGTLSPGFSPNTHTYRVTVPQSVENITLTATPVEGASVSGDGKKTLNTGENTFEITVSMLEESSVYTVIVTRTTADCILEFIRHTEMTTGTILLTYYDLVVNSNVTIPGIDKYELEYALSTGNISGNIPLHFDIENGRYTFDKTVSVAPNSIYKITLNLMLGQYGLGSIWTETKFDGYGRPSSTTIIYNRHLCSVVASESNDVLSANEINIAGTGIANISASELVFIGNGNFNSIKESSVVPAITVSLSPGTDFVKISGLKGNETLYFYHINGQLAASRKASGEIESVPVNHLPAGIYFVKTDTGQALKWVKE